jgi:hypothetical protein
MCHFKFSIPSSPLNSVNNYHVTAFAEVIRFFTLPWIDNMSPQKKKTQETRTRTESHPLTGIIYLCTC